MYQEKVESILLASKYLTICKLYSPQNATIAQQYLTQKIAQLLNQNVISMGHQKPEDHR